MKKLVICLILVSFLYTNPVSADYNPKTLRLSGEVVKAAIVHYWVDRNYDCYNDTGHVFETSTAEGIENYSWFKKKCQYRGKSEKKFDYLTFTVRTKKGNVYVIRIGSTYCISSPLESQWKKIEGYLYKGAQISLRGYVGQGDVEGIIYPIWVDTTGKTFGKK